MSTDDEHLDAHPAEVGRPAGLTGRQTRRPRQARPRATLPSEASGGAPATTVSPPGALPPHLGPWTVVDPDSLADATARHIRRRRSASGPRAGPFTDPCRRRPPTRTVSHVKTSRAAAAVAGLVVVGGLGVHHRLRRHQHRLPGREPAGIGITLPLPIDQLHPAGWAALRARQDRLPLDRLRRRSDWASLYHLERHAATRVAKRLRVDDDQRYSLAHHHDREVERLAAAAAPHVVETRQRLAAGGGRIVRPVRPIDSWWRQTMPSAMVGWPTWLRNRQVRLRELRFKAVTLPAYRGVPLLGR